MTRETGIPESMQALREARENSEEPKKTIDTVFKAAGIVLKLPAAY